MFSPHLFTHKYDIDTIIAALCGTTPQWLETATGSLSATQPTGIEPTHVFAIEPLPESFLKELANSPETAHLSPEQQAELTEILVTHTIATLPESFAHGRTGGWIRERVKEAALEWLDTHNLIPPSMRHINRQKAAKLYASRTVAIQDTE